VPQRLLAHGCPSTARGMRLRPPSGGSTSISTKSRRKWLPFTRGIRRTANHGRFASRITPRSPKARRIHSFLPLTRTTATVLGPVTWTGCRKAARVRCRSITTVRRFESRLRNWQTMYARAKWAPEVGIASLDRGRRNRGCFGWWLKLAARLTPCGRYPCYLIALAVAWCLCVLAGRLPARGVSPVVNNR